MEKKYLTVPFEVKEIKEQEQDGQKFGVITGLAATFGNIDSYADRILKGAFTNTLQKYRSKNRQIRMFYQHNFINVIGGFDTYKETSKGLEVSGKINLSVQKGKEAYALAKQGVLTDFSIGYRPLDYSWVTEKVAQKDGQDLTMQIREIKEIDLFEISLVSNPANEEAVVTDIKSFEKITDASKLLKERGFSNREANEIIHFIKSCRNDNDDDARNELSSKIDQLKFINSIDSIIDRLKKGM